MQMKRRRFITLMFYMAGAALARIGQARGRVEVQKPPAEAAPVINAWLLIAGNELAD